jgi:FlaA1/EpsC-like NDP-sugar epimerase
LSASRGLSSRWLPRSVSGRHVTRAIVDCVAWAVALAFCTVLRLGSHGFAVWRLGTVIPVVIVIQLVAGFTFDLYRGRWVFGSVEEVAAVARTVVIAGSGGLILDTVFWKERPIPISAMLAGGSMALLLMAAVRFGWRIESDRRVRRSIGDGARVIVFGAGSGGRRALRAMMSDPASGYVPVALLDDDPALRGVTYRGVQVVGDRSDMALVAAKFRARMLVIALPSATGPVLRELSELAQRDGLEVRVLPSVSELLGGEVRVVDIREPTDRDLLGRHHVETNLDEVAAYLRGKRVLVTGAGGSIGSELCRQIARFEPAALLMLDRDESALHAVQLSIEGRALLDSPDLVLVDIRDRHRVRELFCDRRPQVVFHAAALKHLPLLERHPVEALKTNVWGTLAVLEASAAVGVERFVNISTDKAANPCSILGFSKRVAEGLTSGFSRNVDGRYLSVRFGNVLGSRGSVLTSFQRQLELGGPLTVTHPDVTRFFMTVEEAVQLVVQAAAIGDGGSALVLEMGEPVRIAEVAEQLAQTHKPACAIEYTGLRPGEKVHEELFGDGEIAAPSAHPLIRSVAVPSLSGDDVRDLLTTISSEETRVVFLELCARMAMSLGAEPELDLWDDDEIDLVELEEAALAERRGPD